VVEELQFTLGEGPCIDTFTSGAPVLEPHLRDPDQVRWHEFSGPALAAGVEAILGFPLVVGGVLLGALDLYVDHPWVLTAEQYAEGALAVYRDMEEFGDQRMTGPIAALIAAGR
jgi:hypothetical protein